MQDGVKSSEKAEEIKDPFEPRRTLTASEEGEQFAASVANSVLNSHSRGPSPSPLCWQAPAAAAEFPTAQAREESSLSAETPVEILKTRGVSGLQDAIICYRWNQRKNPTMAEIKEWTCFAQFSPEDVFFVETHSPAILTEMNHSFSFKPC